MTLGASVLVVFHPFILPECCILKLFSIPVLLYLFVSSQKRFMTILTILLVAIFFAAWKAPRWVKEIGLFALWFGILSSCLGFEQASRYIGHADPEVSQNIIFSGLAVSLIPTIYGIIIYLVSLIVRTLQKPRL